jgi:hypothetical protein
VRGGWRSYSLTVLVLLAVYWATASFRLSEAWFPVSLGVAGGIMAIVVVVAAFAGSPRQFFEKPSSDWLWFANPVALMAIAYVGAWVIAGRGVPALATKLGSAAEWVDARVSRSLDRPRRGLRRLLDNPYRIVVRVGVPPEGEGRFELRIGEDVYERISGTVNTKARIRRNWFGTWLEEIEAASSDEGAVPRIEL